MYVGRLLIVGITKNGGIAAAYRLASQSFSNRKIEVKRDSAKVEPIPGYEEEVDKNPYLSYTCLRIVTGNSIIVANGKHLDQIYDRIKSGASTSNAIAHVLAEMGPEQDAYKTPRITGFASPTRLLLGIITGKKLIVKSFHAKAGIGYYVATYQKTDPVKNLVKNFDARSAADVAKLVHKGPNFKRFSHGIATTAALIRDWKIEISSFP